VRHDLLARPLRTAIETRERHASAEELEQSTPAQPAWLRRTCADALANGAKVLWTMGWLEFSFARASVAGRVLLFHDRDGRMLSDDRRCR
jgi:hypothetical protein